MGNEFPQKLSFGSMLLLTLTLKLRMTKQNIKRRVLRSVLNDILPLNMFLALLLHAGIHQHCKAVFWPLSELMGTILA